MEIFALITIIVAYLLKFIYPKFKGHVGEEVAKSELNKLGKEYEVLNDIMIYSDNKTHQIDNIVVSIYGIFVIEMKNYGGKVVGKEQDKEWTQYIGSKINKLRNPIIQNYGHILSLKDITHLKEDKFISIVCFNNSVELNVKSNNKVVKIKELNKVINSYKTIKLENYIEIKNIISKANIEDKKIRKEHIKNIKKR